MGSGTRSVRRRASALALLLSFGLAVPTRASDAPDPQPARLSLAAAAHAERADPGRALQSAPESAPAPQQSRPFFKTRRGVVTAILMAAGLGWVIYSKSNEGVTSPAND